MPSEPSGVGGAARAASDVRSRSAITTESCTSGESNWPRTADPIRSCKSGRQAKSTRNMRGAQGAYQAGLQGANGTCKEFKEQTRLKEHRENRNALAVVAREVMKGEASGGSVTITYILTELITHSGTNCIHAHVHRMYISRILTRDRHSIQ